MVNSIKNIFVSLALVLLLFVVFWVTKHSYDNKLEEILLEKRTATIKNDSLRKISDGYYKKLVADTLTKRELKKLVDSLNIEVKNPRVVIVTEFIPRNEEEDSPAEESSYTDSIYYSTDYYPQKENYFIKHSSEIDLKLKKDKGRFSFGQPIKITMAVEQLADGTFETSLNAPDFIQLEKFDFQSLPMTEKKPDNFGWLAGAGYFNNITTQEQGIEITGGLRLNKFYLLGSAQTNSTLGLKALLEF